MGYLKCIIINVFLRIEKMRKTRLVSIKQMKINFIKCKEIKSPQNIMLKGLLFAFAVRTGLEPATPCVTGTYSNQLNYRTR